MQFAKPYIDHVLTQNFNDFRELFFEDLLDIHLAHLIMLTRTGILDPTSAKALAEALETVGRQGISDIPFDGSFEDAFFCVENLLAALCGPETAGRLHTARSRNDIDVTLYRLRWRKEILAVQAAALDLRSSLLAVCRGEINTVYPMYTHTQAAQPSTLAHYLHGIVEHLERDHQRLESAFRTMNRCPLGSCAVTGTSFPIDRAMTAELLAFEGPTGNTHGSIAAADYLLEGVSAIMVLLSMLGRFLQDLLLWSTTEFQFLRLADGFVQSSSIMPQKRNPVSLEHSRALASRALGQASAVFQVLHNTPFGDVVDIEDDLQPLVQRVFLDARRPLQLVASALATATFNREKMAREARSGWITATDFADHLVQRQRIPFRDAHRVAARAAELAQRGIEMPDALAEASLEVLGRGLSLSKTELSELLCPLEFVLRRPTSGGPKPSVLEQALSESDDALFEDKARLEQLTGRLDVYREELRRVADELKPGY